MYCVVTKEVGSANDLADITVYGPFVSELLARTFAQKRLYFSNRPEIEWHIAELCPDAQAPRNFVDAEFEIRGTTPYVTSGPFRPNTFFPAK